MTSTLILIALAVVVLVAIAAVLKTLSRPGGTGGGPTDVYARAPALLTPAERSFFGVLEQAVGSDYRIFAKVRVADVLVVKPGLERTARQRAFNRISAKHFDFVLCRRDDLSIALAIELDDASHQQKRRQARDAFVAEVCRSAQLPLLQVPAKAGYSIDDLRAQVDSVLPRGTADVVAETSVSMRSAEAPAAPATAVPACPKCSGAMVERRFRSGPDAGKALWGCTRYPACRGTVAID